MNTKIMKKSIQFLIGISGAYLIIHFTSWQVAVGITLLMWANNFDYKNESDE